MKKLFKSTLSLALALVLMLSLGVAAFADDSAKSDNKEKRAGDDSDLLQSRHDGALCPAYAQSRL